ncbi:ribosome-binding factor A [Thermobispora bispora]|uniref:Ribosome-binding factor A n=1 Tax=Thermobispora bispora (strain ATCC 19993 / DSM 43833 / CBS 139.67 / JCM 10125 / KCTC 9307 / NBRC 14880 / R51) TaxID=469371 RepID=D6Y7W6_THEBD|nr:30S ribosome-binding factor RbfA [Thermobispora bispora]ADG87785.1 ribosome-binding factor A [Thermobispora bispora DSM 43833]MBO2473670.1 30S ribosome-binding factor RbfA [Actinomycetales bacterium]MBX6169660.1 30S ribosome-binding factor RbfA [Thermobispora bispora]
MDAAARARRLADRIKQVVAEMLERRIKDPRLGFVTVTDARITADLSAATVYYTVFGSEEERAATAAALESAKGLIRSEVGRRTGLRHTPTIAFVHDPLPASARHLDDLFAIARARDAEIAKQAEGAQFAGDADPYRVPKEAEEDRENGEEDGEEDTASGRAGDR